MIVFHDPFDILLRLFQSRWGRLNFDVSFVPPFDPEAEDADKHPLKDAPDALGGTVFPDDGSQPGILIRGDQQLHQLLDIMAHELAHMATGTRHDEDDGHTSEWEEAYKWLFEEYGKHVAETRQIG